MSDFLTLLFANLLVGIFSFGGGKAYIPVFQNIYVEHFNIITNLKLTEVVSYILVFPGPIAPMIAGVIGFELFHVKGFILGLLALSIVPLLLFLFVWSIYKNYSENEKIIIIANYLSPAIIGLLLSVCLTLFMGVRPKNQGYFYDIYFLTVFALSTLILSKTKIHPIILIVVSGISGYFLM